MFLHLSHDEKFIDAAHDAFERATPGRHDFIVVDSDGPLRYINSFEPRRMSLRELLNPAFLATLPSYDAVFLHSLNKPNRLVVDAAPKGARFVWLGWGYDYYSLIGPLDALLLPKTRALMRVVQDDSRAGSFAALAKAALASPGCILPGLRSRFIGPGGRNEYKLVQKIGLFSPVLPTEYVLLRLRHPDFRPRYASWNYGVHDIVDALAAPTTQRAHRAVVGNSATPECNHLEAFDALASFEGEVVVPLSYGNPSYREAILKVGRERLGERFRPLTDFMAADAYAALIGGSSHLVMNHLRQQGLTNVLIALQSGTRVTMQRGNPLFPYLTGLGLQVDDIAGGLADAPRPEALIARDRQIVSDVFGPAQHHHRTCQFLAAVERAWEPACTP